MIAKKRGRKGKREQPIQVTFSLVRPDAQSVHLLGEFNAWMRTLSMTSTADGEWRTTLPLPPGREYEFRYLIDDTEWLNDPEADRYTPNPFGGENSVVAT